MLEKIKALFECLFTWRVKPKGRVSGADVVGAFAFGFRENKKPGKSNKAIARIVEILNQKFCLSVIVQWEIAAAMKRGSCYAIIRKHLKVEDKYLDTMEVARQIVEKMRKQRWKKVVVLAHPLHVWRCVKVLERMGVETIIPAGLDLIPFDKKSEQWWTRNVCYWTFKEIFIRLGSLARGWI